MSSTNRDYFRARYKYSDRHCVTHYGHINKGMFCNMDWKQSLTLYKVRIRCSARTHASSLTSATGQTDPRGMVPHLPV